MTDASGRELPQTDIAGSKFWVNVAEMEIIQVDKPGNRVSVEQMLRFPDHYELDFDHKNKCVYQGDWNSKEDLLNVGTVWIRPLKTLDSVGMDNLVKEGKVNWTEHYATPLPVVEIADTKYFVDPIRKGFREMDNRWNVLKFTDIIPKGDGYGVYFDKTANNVQLEFNSYNPPAKLPDHIIFADVPSGTDLGILLKNVKTVKDVEEEKKQATGQRTGRRM